MPASMMTALVGFIWKLSGSSMAMVAGGPNPGSTPTTVPRKQPAKHQKMLIGVNATAKPWNRPLITSIASESQHAHRQAHVERQRKDEVEAERGSGGYRERHLQWTAVHHRNDEQRHQPEA